MSETEKVLREEEFEDGFFHLFKMKYI